jgi:hypothetical protein
VQPRTSAPLTQSCVRRLRLLNWRPRCGCARGPAPRITRSLTRACAARQRAHAEALARRVATLEQAAAEAAALRARNATLERSLALVREVAGGDAARPLCSPQVQTAGEHAGALQSALSGFGQAPARAADAPRAPGAAAARARTGREMVVDSHGCARKRGRPAGAGSRRPGAAAHDRSTSPEPAPQPSAGLPPPLSPLRPSGEQGALPPPLSPLLPRAARAPPPPLGTQRAAPVAPKCQLPPLRPRKAPAAPASVTPPAPPAPPAEVELGRAGAVALGKVRARPPPAAALPGAAGGAPAASAELHATTTGDVAQAAHAQAEAAAACVTSEAGTCAALLDALRLGADAAAAAARGLASAALTRTVSPAAMLAGVVAAARSDEACDAPALPAAVLSLDAALARAHQTGRGGAVRLLGGGAEGGFADAVTAVLRSAVLEGVTGRGAAPGPCACAAVALMHARGQLPAARTLLLDALQHGDAAGGAASPLAAAACGALRGWPHLLAGCDPLAMAAAAVLRAALDDTSADGGMPAGVFASLQLGAPLASASADDAVTVALAWLHRCAVGAATDDALHSAVRALELLASHAGACFAPVALLGLDLAMTARFHAGWAWADEHVVQPHLCTLMRSHDDSAAAAAARALAPLVLVGLQQGEQAPALADARQLLSDALQARHGQLSGVACASAEAALEVDGRAAEGSAPERAAAVAWWHSLDGAQHAAAPRRLLRALHAAGVHVQPAAAA